MLIGLTGKALSGKDTVCKIIQEWGPRVEHRAFADALKNSACALLGITRAQLEELKVDCRRELRWCFCDNAGTTVLIPDKSLPSFSMREFLQRYGTEAHREIFGEDFWIDVTLPGDVYDYAGRVVVVTDVRFPNEAQAIHDLGGIVVQVLRDGNGLSGAASQHPSEQDLSEYVDYRLRNDGTIDDLRQEVKKFLNELWESEHGLR